MRRRLMSLLLCLLPLLAACAAPGAVVPAAKAGIEPVAKIADDEWNAAALFAGTGVPLDAVAIDVRAAEGGSALFAHNSARAMAPASVMKLLPTQAALELLGPAHRWVTRVHANGAIVDGVLKGDLVIEGGGDPQLSYQDVWRLLARLRSLGLSEIRGNLLIDRSLFAPVSHDAAAFDGRPEHAYNAPPDALLLNAQALIVRLSPGATGRPATVSSEPPLEGFVIDAPLTADTPCTAPYAQMQPVPTATRLQFLGHYPAECGASEFAVHLYSLDPGLYFGAVFRSLWSQLGGRFEGRVIAGSPAQDSRELVSWLSEPLSQQIRTINKSSSNPMARNLLLSIVAQRGGPPATPEAAAARALGWLAAAGIDASTVVLDNGSGLSRLERIPAATLGALLQRAWQQPTMPEFVASLPVAGVDGTMARRFVGTPLQGRAHIKTGSLADVAAIAGYVMARSGRRIAVVCLVNHPNASAARSAFDRLLTAVWERY